MKVFYKLIYYVDKATEIKRLCILKSIVKNILNTIYIAKKYLKFI